MRRLNGNARCNECWKFRPVTTAFDEKTEEDGGVTSFLVCDFCLRRALPSPLGRKSLNRAAYQKLIDENLAWLDALPRSLERDHVQLIVRLSPDREFGEQEPPEAAASDAAPQSFDAFVVACMDQAWGMGSISRRDEIAGTIEARPPDHAEFQKIIDRVRGLRRT